MTTLERIVQPAAANASVDPECQVLVAYDRRRDRFVDPRGWSPFRRPELLLVTNHHDAEARIDGEVAWRVPGIDGGLGLDVHTRYALACAAGFEELFARSWHLEGAGSVEERIVAMLHDVAAGLEVDDATTSKAWVKALTKAMVERGHATGALVTIESGLKVEDTGSFWDVVAFRPAGAERGSREAEIEVRFVADPDDSLILGLLRHSEAALREHLRRSAVDALEEHVGPAEPLSRLSASGRAVQDAVKQATRAIGRSVTQFRLTPAPGAPEPVAPPPPEAAATLAPRTEPADPFAPADRAVAEPFASADRAAPRDEPVTPDVSEAVRASTTGAASAPGDPSADEAAVTEDAATALTEAPGGAATATAEAAATSGSAPPEAEAVPDKPAADTRPRFALQGLSERLEQALDAADRVAAAPGDGVTFAAHHPSRCVGGRAHTFLVFATPSDPGAVRAGSALTVALEADSDAVVVEPPRITKAWVGERLRFPFDVRVYGEAGHAYRIRASVQIAGVEVARVDHCAVEVTGTVGAEERQQRTGALYQRIYVSHADDDAVQARMAQVREALGDEAVYDVASLRSRADWRAAVRAAIDEADVFQIFWSDETAESEACAFEWRRAKKVDAVRAGFVWVVRATSPVPALPDELHKHRIAYVPPVDEDVTSR